jgi:hypothetical protein
VIGVAGGSANLAAEQTTGGEAWGEEGADAGCAAEALPTDQSERLAWDLMGSLRGTAVREARSLAGRDRPRWHGHRPPFGYEWLSKEEALPEGKS